MCIGRCIYLSCLCKIRKPSDNLGRAASKREERQKRKDHSNTKAVDRHAGLGAFLEEPWSMSVKC